jgi:hypothetical protein
VNGNRLSTEGAESAPEELKNEDLVVSTKGVWAALLTCRNSV